MFFWPGKFFVEEPAIALLPNPKLRVEDPPVPDAVLAERMGIPVIHICVQKFGAVLRGEQRRHEARDRFMYD